MNASFQMLVVIGIVIAATLFLAYKWSVPKLRKKKKGDCGPDCGCS